MRIYTSESDPLDFCWRCFPKTEQKAFDKYGHNGDGPDGRGNCFTYNAEAPWFYDDDYECANCGKKLTEYNSAYNSPLAVPLTYGTKETFKFDGDYCYYIL